jgi:NADH:ubiquinone oxidoreductase subunit K
MSTMRDKPSKPSAILTFVIGIGMIVFAATQFADATGGTLAFFVFWCVAAVAIIGFNVWAAFARNGSIADIVTEEPRR